MLLDDIKVLDFCSNLAGAHATMELAAMGAEVVKIERPGSGDNARNLGPDAGDNGDISALFAAANLGKKSVTVDLKTEEGKKIALELAKTADVVMTDMQMSTMERLGLGYEDIKAVKNDVIYCAVSAYGQDCDLKDEPAYELNAQARFVLMSGIGPKDGDFCRCGYPVVSINTGVSAVGAVLAAILHRMDNNEGQFIDTSLMMNAIHENSFLATRFLVDGVILSPQGTMTETSAYPYQGAPTKDGYIIYAMSGQKQWLRFCANEKFHDLCTRPEYFEATERFPRKFELRDKLDEIFKTMTTAEAVELLDKVIDIPVAPINTMEDMFKDPYVVETTLETVPHSNGKDYVVPKLPYIFSSPDMVKATREPAPALGQDTDSILKELGYSDAEIAKLHEDKAV